MIDTELVTRQVYGTGSRWLGWNSWMKSQPIFKHILKKLEEGKIIGCKKSTQFFRVGLDGTTDPSKMIGASVDYHGDLELLYVPGENDGISVLEMRPGSSTYVKDIRDWVDTKKERILVGQMFEDPHLPTEEELELFSVIHGSPSLLIEINQMYIPSVLKFNKALTRNDVEIFFPF